MVKLHVIVSGLVLIPVLILGFLSYYNNGVEIYQPADYDNSSFEFITNTLNDTTNVVNKTANRIKALESDSSVFDLFGALISGAYSAVIIAYEGVTSAQAIIVHSITGLPIGEFSNNIVVLLLNVVTIVMFIGIGLHIITKSDRT